MFVTQIDYEARAHEQLARRTAAASTVASADTAATVATLTARRRRGDTSND